MCARLRQQAALSLFFSFLLVFVSLVGCGDDDGPTKPKIVEDDENALPEIPALVDAQAEPPSRSETVTSAKAASDYCPAVVNVRANISVDGRGKYESLSGGWIDCYGDWRNGIYVGFEWLDQLPTATANFGSCGLLTSYTAHGLALATSSVPSTQRVVLMENKTLLEAPPRIGWETGYGPSICRESIPLIGCTSRVALKLRYSIDGRPLTEQPHLRRDRFWVSVPWESGNHVERMTGAGSITGSSSYTQGSSIAETESFAYTVGAEIGASGDVLSASVSASLTQTFSTTVTVSESETRSFARQLEGSEGKRTCFVLWVLYEQYSFTHEDGTPFTDPYYAFDPGIEDPGSDRFYQLQIAGGQAEATAYVFDMGSGKLESMVTVD